MTARRRAAAAIICMVAIREAVFCSRRHGVLGSWLSCHDRS